LAKRYRLGGINKAMNGLFRLLTRLGLGAKYRHILTVRGRKTGKALSTPVDVMEMNGRLFLAAPYGIVSWVKNVRATQEVTLSRGGRTVRGRAVELSPEESAPVLRKYLEEVAVTRPYFDVTLESTDKEFAAQSARHPAFEVIRE
jgi:deazaflavin-dependent oxidoreductase (nitroreductase family)